MTNPEIPKSLRRQEIAGRVAITTGHGQLPVVTLDLQKFEDKTWMAGGIFITDRVAWDKRMGWWGAWAWACSRCWRR